MTEPIFEVLSKKRKMPQKSQQQTHSSYNLLLQQYLSQSYGYYTELFIKNVSQKAQNQHENLRKFQFRKLLRETVQKYLMTDLEIIFLQYFATLHLWNYQIPLIEQSVIQKNTDNQCKETNCFKLFLQLVSFFVKTYVGSKEEVMALVDFHNQHVKYFNEIYQLWILNSPQNCFKISPRELNQIYTHYTRSCGEKVIKKDYNQMVDKILDLSTTYSIMPLKEKQSKSKKSSSKGSKQIISVFSKKNSLRNVDSQIWQQNSFRLDFSDLRSNQKDTVFHGGSSFINANQSKVQVLQEEKKNDSSLPKKISLNKKKKIQKDEVNTVAKTFFRGKDLNLSVEDMKKSQNNVRDFLPNSFLDLNVHSSRIQNLPLPYRNNSNIFGPSTLF